ncbi:18031_t:CDS:2, partial [Racocetra fulgida]
EKGINLSDASSLLTKLLEFQANDPQWFVKLLIDDNHLIGSFYHDFLKDFKNIQHSHCEEVFEQRIQGLIEKYKAGEKYITMLLDRKYTWVKCFTSRCFTAGTQSTQRVESENGLIKKAIQSSSSFLEVQEALENRLEFESINNRYSIWKSSTLQYTQPFIIQTFFTISMSEILLSDDDLFEPFFEKELDDNLDILLEADEDRELNLQSLISIVNHNEILEIWKDEYFDSGENYFNEMAVSDSNHSDTPIISEFTRKYTIADLSESAINKYQK